MLFYIERIYLKEISTLIRRKDIRTVKKWCKENQLKIHKDSSGEFVYQNDFDLAYDIPLIYELKLKYGNEWEDYYHAYNSDELHKMLDLSKTRNEEKKEYVPKGKLSRKLFGGSQK